MATRDINGSETSPVQQLFNYLQKKSCVCETNQQTDACEWFSSFSDWCKVSMQYHIKSNSGESEKKSTLGCYRGYNPSLDEPYASLYYLTVGKSLYEASYCIRLQRLQKALIIDGSLLECLHILLGSENRLVAFMACKMVRALMYATTNKDVVMSFMKNILQRSKTSSQSLRTSASQDVYSLSETPCLNYDRGSSYVDTSTTNDDLNLEPCIRNVQCYSHRIKGVPDKVNLHYCADNILPQNVISHPSGLQIDQAIPLQCHHMPWEDHIHANYASPWKPEQLGQVNHAIFTFDLFRYVITAHNLPCSRVDIEAKEGIAIPCKHMPPATAHPHERLKDIYGDLMPLLHDHLGHYPPCNNQILASKLDCMHALLEFGNGDVICNKMLFVDLLQNYYTQREIVKKILDICILLLEHTEGKRGLAITILDKLFSEDDLLESIPCTNLTVGFGGNIYLSADKSGFGDRALLRKVCKVTFLSMLCNIGEDSQRTSNQSGNTEIVDKLSHWIFPKLNTEVIATELITWLFELFGEQDDSLVWLMLCALNIHQRLGKHETINQLNPHSIFNEFLNMVSHDPSVLLDWLISSETQFLEYLVQYLRVVNTDWDRFYMYHTNNTRSLTKKPKRNQKEIRNQKGVVSCEKDSPLKRCKITGEDLTVARSVKKMKNYTDNENCVSLRVDTAHLSGRASAIASDRSMTRVSESLDNTMTTLIRLRFLIERITDSNLFPYPVRPLVRLMEIVEDKFDNME